MKKRKTIFLSHFVVLSILIALVFGCVGFLVGSVVTIRVTQPDKLNNSSEGVFQGLFDKPKKGITKDELLRDYQYGYAQGISLLYEFDNQTGNYNGQCYHLCLDGSGEKCRFSYYSYDPFRYQNDRFDPYEEVVCDFSVQTYYDLLAMVCDEDLVRYEYSTDSDGKIIYDNEPYVLGLTLSLGADPVIFNNPSNIADIIHEFERLKDIAEQ